MKFEAVQLVLMVVGILLLIFSVYLILARKPIVKNDLVQRINFGRDKSVELSPSLLILVFSGLLAFAPYGLTLWKLNPADYIAKSEAERLLQDAQKSAIRPQDFSILITGHISTDDGQDMRGANIDVIREYSEQHQDTVKRVQPPNDENGEFKVTIDSLTASDGYKVVWSKNGYTSQTLRLDVKQRYIGIPIVLAKGGNN